MLAYAGPPLALGELLMRPPHSLEVQSYRPREMVTGTVSADGFGAALWLDDGRPDPAVYRTAAPIWADPNLAWMGERLRVRAAIAAVRSATPGIGYELSSVQPFARGRLAFCHNGFVARFRHGPQRAMRERLGDPAYQSIHGGSDSEHLFALVLDELDRGAGIAGAVRGALRTLGRICEEQRTTAVATLLLSDGEELVGCRWAAGTAPASLYAAAYPAPTGGGAPEGVCIASEPLDVAPGPAPAGPESPRGRWREVPPQHAVIARPGAPLEVQPL